jgi:hypothetical protein
MLVSCLPPPFTLVSCHLLSRFFSLLAISFHAGFLLTLFLSTEVRCDMFL